ncbi:MAG TPA: hypothetical protein VKB75_17250 [Jatrophihabitans sp.]|nr:hypothetical protein [Jatrophihabitans sp.]
MKIRCAREIGAVEADAAGSVVGAVVDDDGAIVCGADKGDDSGDDRGDDGGEVGAGDEVAGCVAFDVQAASTRTAASSWYFISPSSPASE